MAYCATTDLLLGDMEPGSIDLQSYVDSAAEEIDGRLGYVYDLDDVHGLEQDSPGWLILKKINRFIASGRVIMAQAIAAENESLNAYGGSLVRLAYGDLALILSKELPLDATAIGESVGRTPGIVNRDATSGVEAFEDNFMKWNGGLPSPRVLPVWEPGD